LTEVWGYGDHLSAEKEKDRKGEGDTSLAQRGGGVFLVEKEKSFFMQEKKKRLRKMVGTYLRPGGGGKKKKRKTIPFLKHTFEEQGTTAFHSHDKGGNIALSKEEPDGFTDFRYKKALGFKEMRHQKGAGRVKEGDGGKWKEKGNEEERKARMYAIQEGGGGEGGRG